MDEEYATEQRRRYRRSEDRALRTELAKLRSVHEKLETMDDRLIKLETRVNLLFAGLAGLVTLINVALPVISRMMQ